MSCAVVGFFCQLAACSLVRGLARDSSMCAVRDSSMCAVRDSSMCEVCDDCSFSSACCCA